MIMQKMNDPLIEIERLQARLEEAEQTLRAIRSGEVDAFVVSGPQGEKVFTLKGSEHLPRLILQEMAEGVVTVAEGHIVYANRCFARMTKLDKDTIVSRPVMDFISPMDHELFERLLKASRYVSAQGELTLVDAFGNAFPVQVTLNFLEADAISGYCLILRDLTDLKKAQAEILRAKDNLELRVAERTRELAVSNESLARSNNELEQFAYVSSHDLQEPLRTIAVYADLFRKYYDDKLDDRGREFLEFIHEGSQRARALIQALLSYARIGRADGAHQPVVMDHVVDMALANLKVLIDENGARITRDPLPFVKANEIEMVQLFQNLISNAVKYRGEKAPEIHISVKQEGDYWIFGVKDNGIGIDNQYLDYIFLIFKRLHGRSSYSGAGIGLSVCKKIVEKHGGEIWVESTPGAGSIFYFAIPIV
jgi:PAS domain S-box-containing protein